MKHLATTALILFSATLLHWPAQAATGSGKAPINTASNSCPCSGSKLCTGPKGGKFCYTAGGKKRYQR